MSTLQASLGFALGVFVDNNGPSARSRSFILLVSDDIAAPSVVSAETATLVFQANAGTANAVVLPLPTDLVKCEIKLMTIVDCQMSITGIGCRLAIVG